MEVVMKLSLFNNINKQLKAEIDEYWSEVKMEEIPEDKLRHPNDPSYKISHLLKNAGMNWEIEINYNRSNYDEIVPVSERSVSFYYQVTLKNGDKVYRTVHVYENEIIFGHVPKHTHRASVETKVNGNVVARYRQDIDLLEDSGRVRKDIGWTIYRLVTRP